MEFEEPKVNLYRKIVLKYSARPSIEVSEIQEDRAVDLSKKNNEKDQINSPKEENLKSKEIESQHDPKIESTEKSKYQKNKKSDEEYKKKRKFDRNKNGKKSRSRSQSRGRSKERKNKKSKNKHKKHHKKNSRKRSRSHSGENHKRKTSKKKYLIENIIQDKNMEKIIDKKRLLALAKNEAVEKKDKNFVNIFQETAIPQSKLIFNRPIEKSIGDFVEFCKNLAKDNSNDNEVNFLNKLQNEIETVKKDNNLFIRPLNYNLDVEINRKVNDVITKLFPVSSGTHHRVVEENKDKIDENPYLVSGQNDQIIPVENAQYKKIVPNAEIIKVTNLGKYSGVPDANFLKPEELEGEYKAWTRKDLLKTAAPITDGIGKKLLEKMGWKAGEGLGKNREGPVEPIKLDVKLNRKGLEAEGLVKERTQKQIEGKHPVSCLLELCRARKWLDPVYETIEESGPSHQKFFLMKVTLNNMSYQPSSPSPNKKLAKAMAAYVCLQALGIQSAVPV